MYYWPAIIAQMWTSVQQTTAAVALMPRAQTLLGPSSVRVNPATREMASHAPVSQFQQLLAQSPHPSSSSRFVVQNVVQHIVQHQSVNQY